MLTLFIYKVANDNNYIIERLTDRVKISLHFFGHFCKSSSSSLSSSSTAFAAARESKRPTPEAWPSEFFLE